AGEVDETPGALLIGVASDFVGQTGKTLLVHAEVRLAPLIRKADDQALVCCVGIEPVPAFPLAVAIGVPVRGLVPLVLRRKPEASARVVRRLIVPRPVG